MLLQGGQSSKIIVIFGPEIWDSQQYGGISKYFAELILELRKLSFIQIRVLTHSTTNVEIQRLMKKQEVIVLKKGSLKSFLKSEKRNSEGKIIYHSTYYNLRNLLIAKLIGYQVVLTVYDFISELYPVKKRKIHRPRIQEKKWCIRFANKVIAISNTTLADLQAIYKISDSKVKVIYLASGIEPVTSKVKRTTTQKYILYVGKRAGYKNFKIVLEAMKILKEQNIKIQLIAYGGGILEEEFGNFINESDLESLVGICSPQESDLVDLYANATAFVYPSLYEGFGIPILDAMQLNCPVIGSDIPSTREISGNFITLFDPTQPHELAEAFKLHWSRNTDFEILISNAYLRSTSFSWQMTAHQTAEEYSQLSLNS